MGASSPPIGPNSSQTSPSRPKGGLWVFSSLLNRGAPINPRLDHNLGRLLVLPSTLSYQEDWTRILLGSQQYSTFNLGSYRGSYSRFWADSRKASSLIEQRCPLRKEKTGAHAASAPEMKAATIQAKRATNMRYINRYVDIYIYIYIYICACLRYLIL